MRPARVALTNFIATYQSTALPSSSIHEGEADAQSPQIKSTRTGRAATFTLNTAPMLLLFFVELLLELLLIGLWEELNPENLIHFVFCKNEKEKNEIGTTLSFHCDAGPFCSVRTTLPAVAKLSCLIENHCDER